MHEYKDSNEAKTPPWVSVQAAEERDALVEALKGAAAMPLNASDLEIARIKDNARAALDAAKEAQ